MKADKRMMRRTVAVALALGLAGAARAGSLTPPGAPAPTMNSLTELYQKLTNTLAEVQAANQRLTNTLAHVQLANQRLTNTLDAVQITQQSLTDMRSVLSASGMQQTSGSMVLIPAGSFVMGACTNVGQEGISDGEPQHTVNVSGFYMDKYEVASNLWREVYTWATNRGYSFANPGACKAPGHPVQTVRWRDCLAWCNARSQRDGFAPCYTNANGAVYTNSTPDFLGDCNWSASGYRLPTEAEWEKAARGGLANMRFPWGDANTIQHARANYYSYWVAGKPYYSYDASSTPALHPSYSTGGSPYTSPVGSFVANGYGLYDMAGNVLEWCWDWYHSAYYSVSPLSDPRGPSSLAERVLRGGNWNDFPYFSRSAHRYKADPSLLVSYVGFRTVRRAP
jgi:formylglycine-generating enzyme required for sulfatase activity